MIIIEVYRDAGDRRGNDVVDPLIGSVPCAVERGRVEMDAQAHPRTKVTMTIVYRSGLRPGQLVKAMDLDGTWYIGMVTGVAHNLVAGKCTTTLTIDKPEA